MPSQNNITNIPSSRVDFIDQRTGLMSREWYRFFLNLFNLTGAGNNPTSLDDLQVGPPSGGGESAFGTVTSVQVSGGTTGLTTSGGPITSAGTITFAGTLNVANGGTGATTAAGARTNLGATTIGGNMYTLTNPSAITFPRFNADNTVSALDAASFRTAIGAGTGTGSVTSVATGTGLTGGPITTTGTVDFAVPAVGTWAATPSSANLAAAMTDETGSGSLVFGTGPTLSAPVIDGANPYIQFNNGSAVTVAAGKMWYDGATGSWNLGMGGGNITQQVGEELFIYGKASAAITEGQLIVKTGTVGASGVITFAPSPTGLTTNDGIIGVATENIALNGFGRITYFGVVHGINTTGASVGETWADNDTLYYNPSYVGGLTKVKPSAPYVKYGIATVINAGGGGSGSIQVDLQPGSTLGGTDSNVQLGTPSNGQILTYDGADSYWKNTSIASGTGISISAASDGTLTITNTSPSSGGTVTSVTGTSPVVSSGGTTPAISLASGYGDTQNPYASKTANYFLAAPNGSSGVPTFRAVVAADIPTLNQNTTGTAAGLSATLAIASGGTGQTTASAAFNALSPVTSTGDLIVGNGTNSSTRLPIGTSGYVLTSNGTTAAWAASTGGVTSFSAGTTGFTPSTGTTGAVTLAGTLNVANGGTGLTSLTANYIPYGNGTSAFSSSANFAYNGTTLRVGATALLGGTTNPIVGVTGTANQYIQQYIYNSNTGTSASADFVAYADNSTDSHGWADVGFTSSTYADATYTVTGKNEAYIFGSAPSGAGATGNLVYATDSTGSANAHQFYVGGFTQAKAAWKAQVDSTGMKATQVNATNGFIVNSMTVSANYTVATGDSAMSVGPMTVASGVSVTVSSGSRWVVI